jgi:hypothetical protein
MVTGHEDEGSVTVSTKAIHRQPRLYDQRLVRRPDYDPVGRSL